MRKFGLAFVCVLGLVLALGALPVNARRTLPVITANGAVQLTEAQQKELATLHQDILEKRKEVVSKYVEYGVISQEKADKLISRLDKRYEMLEKNEFIPHRGKCKKEKLE